jgi:hypothetical protein
MHRSLEVATNIIHLSRNAKQALHYVDELKRTDRELANQLLKLDLDRVSFSVCNCSLAREMGGYFYFF